MNMGNDLAKKDNPITLSQIIFLMPLLVMFVGLVLYISSLQSGVSTANKNVEDMKTDIRDINKKITSMSEDIVEIKTTLGIRATNQAGASALMKATPTPIKQEANAPPASQEQSQTVIAEARPTPAPTAIPAPNPTPAPALIPSNLIPSISVLGVPLLERR